MCVCVCAVLICTFCLVVQFNSVSLYACNAPDKLVFFFVVLFLEYVESNLFLFYFIYYYVFLLLNFNHFVSIGICRFCCCWCKTNKKGTFFLCKFVSHIHLHILKSVAKPIYRLQNEQRPKQMS